MRGDALFHRCEGVRRGAAIAGLVKQGQLTAGWSLGVWGENFQSRQVTPALSRTTRPCIHGVDQRAVVMKRVLWLLQTKIAMQTASTSFCRLSPQSCRVSCVECGEAEGGWRLTHGSFDYHMVLFRTRSGRTADSEYVVARDAQVGVGLLER